MNAVAIQYHFFLLPIQFFFLGHIIPHLYTSLQAKKLCYFEAAILRSYTTLKLRRIAVTDSVVRRVELCNSVDKNVPSIFTAVYLHTSRHKINANVWKQKKYRDNMCSCLRHNMCMYLSDQIPKQMYLYHYFISKNLKYPNIQNRCLSEYHYFISKYQ